MRVLVTGASGFIGSHLVSALAMKGYQVRALTASKDCEFSPGIAVFRQDLMRRDLVPSAAISGVDSVIHLAGRAHIMRDDSSHPLSEFRNSNVHTAIRLAQQAVDCNVRRLIFASSIGVNGSSTDGKSFTEDMAPSCTGPYAISKWEAEQALWGIARESNLELTIVRLPLVYGPGVKGNFLRLLRLIDAGIPLPLNAVHNLRSYVGVSNVCDFIDRCLQHSAAAGKLFLLADGEDLSTPDLIRAMAAAIARPARLYRFPLGMLQVAANFIGRTGDFERLVGSLQVDASRARRVLDWSPPVDLHSGIMAMGNWYIKYRSSAISGGRARGS